MIEQLAERVNYSCTPTPDDTLIIARSVKGCEATIMKGMGHFPMSGDPKSFLAYQLPVLTRIRATSERRRPPLDRLTGAPPDGRTLHTLAAWPEIGFKCYHRDGVPIERSGFRAAPPFSGGSTMTRHLLFAITVIGTGLLLNSAEASTAVQCEERAANCLGRCKDMTGGAGDWKGHQNKCVSSCVRRLMSCYPITRR